MHPKLTPAAAEVLQVKYSLSHDGGTNFWSFSFFRFSFAIRQLSLSYLDHGSATIQRFFLVSELYIWENFLPNCHAKPWTGKRNRLVKSQTPSQPGGPCFYEKAANFSGVLRTLVQDFDLQTGLSDVCYN